jgi:methionyl-tRNA formyltransferase
MQPAASAVKRLALARGLDVLQPVHLRSPDVARRLAAAQPEAFVVAAYGLLLPPQVLDLAPFGAWNIHASLLPRWRGAAPIQRALLAGDRETGISIMRMDPGLDTGPVLAQHRLPVADDDDAGTLHDKLAALGAQAIVAALAELQAGRARAIEQPEVGVTHARKIDRKDTILNWSLPAAELERAVRAFRPSPGAATLLQGEAIKIWRAAIVAGQGKAGTVLAAGDALVVACGDGALAITELQRAGGTRLAVADFLRGRALSPGVQFG